MTTSNHRFTEAERRGLYRAIHERRDVRSQFLPDRIPPDVLARLLEAAHHAPSVGFMQPWDFIVIESRSVRETVLAMHEQENQKAAERFEGERQEHYRSLKLQGIMESPLNLCITCDRSRGGPHVLGRNSIVETDLFSTCMAVQKPLVGGTGRRYWRWLGEYSRPRTDKHSAKSAGARLPARVSLPWLRERVFRSA